MKTNPNSSMAPPRSLVTWGPVAAVLVTIGIYYVSQFLGAMIVSLGYALVHPNAIAQLRGWLTTSIDAQFFFIVTVEAITLGLLYLFLRARKASFRSIGLRQPKLKDFGFVLVGFGIYFPLLLALFAAIKRFVPKINLEQKQQLGFESAHGGALVLVFISLVILPPLVEEILARGFLYSGLKRHLPTAAAVLITSLLFATAHLQIGSGAALLWAAACDTFLLSLVLIFLREVTDGLWASIGLHMLKNMIAFVALFVIHTP